MQDRFYYYFHSVDKITEAIRGNMYFLISCELKVPSLNFKPNVLTLNSMNFSTTTHTHTHTLPEYGQIKIKNECCLENGPPLTGFYICIKNKSGPFQETVAGY